VKSSQCSPDIEGSSRVKPGLGAGSCGLILKMSASPLPSLWHAWDIPSDGFAHILEACFALLVQNLSGDPRQSSLRELCKLSFYSL
jgi:hypothetical protein